MRDPSVILVHLSTFFTFSTLSTLYAPSTLWPSWPS